MNLSDLLLNVVPSLVVSVVVSVGTSMTNQQVHGRLLEDNILVTKELSKNLSELNVRLSVIDERFVTKDTFNDKILDLTKKDK